MYGISDTRRTGHRQPKEGIRGQNLSKIRYLSCPVTHGEARGDAGLAAGDGGGRSGGE